jgi:hypothetical protein
MKIVTEVDDLVKKMKDNVKKMQEMMKNPSIFTLLRNPDILK